MDYQIGVTTTDMFDATQSGQLQGSTRIITEASGDPVGAFVDATDLGSSGSGDERGLDAAYAALTDPLISGVNAGIVREEAILAVVVISDEDDGSDISRSSFVSWLEAYKGDPALASLSAITGPDNLFGCTGSGWPPVSASGAPKYVQTANATGGTWVNICDLDFDEVLNYLAYTASGLAIEFPLSRTPAQVGPAHMTVEVDGVDVGYSGFDGWTYDAGTNSVVFHGDSIPGPNAQVSISYPVAGGC